MFYYIHEWFKWWSSWENGIKKDECIPELPFEDPLPLQRIEKNEPQPTPDEIPFEEPLPKTRIYKTGWKY